MVTGLNAHTEYSFKAYAINEAGISYGAVQTFTTINTPPIFTSTPITTVNEGKSYLYYISTNDIDGDVVNVTPTTKPNWLNFKQSEVGNVTTLPGTMSHPYGVATDSDNNVYVADRNHHRILKITPTNEVSTFAGSGMPGSDDGIGTAASFNLPRGIAVDKDGNVYVADSGTHIIRKITSDGKVTTLAGSGLSGNVDGLGKLASFNSPYGLAVDVEGNIYVSDGNNHKIRKITAEGKVSTLAGSGSPGSTDGQGTAASFNSPWGIAVDINKNVYVGDAGSYKIRKINMNGQVTTLAGSGVPGNTDGQGTAASFNGTSGLALDASGDIYISEANNHSIRKLSTNGVVSTIAGGKTAGNTDGLGIKASFRFPRAIAIDGDRNLYVANEDFNNIRKISLQNIYVLSTDKVSQAGEHNVVLEASDGNGGKAIQSFKINVNTKPTVISSAASAITASGATLNGEITADGGETITERGFIYAKTSDDPTPTLTEVDGAKIIKVVEAGVNVEAFSKVVANLKGNTEYSFVAYARNSIGISESTIQTFTTQNTPPTITSTPILTANAGERYNYPITTEDVDGDDVTVTLKDNLPAWLKITGSGNAGEVSVIGTFTDFNNPIGLAVDVQGNVYVSDDGKQIKKINANTGLVKTLYTTTQTYYEFWDVALDNEGNVYVPDFADNQIKKINANTGLLEVLANGQYFNNPKSIALDSKGNIYFTYGYDYYSPDFKIGKIYATSGLFEEYTTSHKFTDLESIAIDSQDNLYVTDGKKIIKISTTGIVDELAQDYNFNNPLDIDVDASGNTYVADNNKIIKIAKDGTVGVLAPSESFSSSDAVAVDKLGNVYVTGTSKDRIRKFSGGTVLTGTAPNTTGTYNIVLTANDGNNGTATQSFTIKVIGKPTVTSSAATAITASGATLNGEATADINAPITKTGFVYSVTSENADPVIDGNKVVNKELTTTTSPFSLEITGLKGRTQYSFKAYAVNEAGISYGAVQTFITLNSAPVFTSTPQLKVNEGATYSYTITTEDADGDDVTVTLKDDLPTWLEITGSGNAGERTQLGLSANFGDPWGVAVDDLGNVYVADYANHKIKKIHTTGIVEVLADESYFNNPIGVAVDGQKNVYVVDDEGKIKKINATTGLVEVLADGFYHLAGIALDSQANVYVTDGGNKYDGDPISYHVTKVNATTGVKEKLAPTHKFNEPRGLAIDDQGNVYVVENLNTKIKKISSDGIVTELVIGNYFSTPDDIALDNQGNVYVADRNSPKIIKINSQGIVTKLEGNFIGSGPTGVAIDEQGNVYVADAFADSVYKISGGTVLTGTAPNTAGTHDIKLTADDGNNGIATQTFIIKVIGKPTVTSSPATAITASGATLNGEATADTNAPITKTGFVYSVTSENADPLIDGDKVVKKELTTSTSPFSLEITGLKGRTQYSFKAYAINEAGISYGAVQTFTTTNTSPTFTSTPVLTVNEGETYTYPITTEDADGDDVTLTLTQPNQPSWLSLSTGKAGDVTVLATSQHGFRTPYGVAVDASGNVYVADSDNNKIRKIATDGSVTTLADSHGFNRPYGVAVDASGNVYVADTGNGKIKKIATDGIVTTLATSHTFNYPSGVAVDGSGNVYVAEPRNHQIKKIATDGIVTTLATSHNFKSPFGVAVDGSGNIYVADTENSKIKKIEATDGSVITLADSHGFNRPYGVAVDASGNVYVADTENFKIKKIATDGIVTTLASSHGFNIPTGVAVDALGNVYVAEPLNHKIKKISAGTTVLSGTAPPPTDNNEYSVTLTADDDNGGVTTQTFTIDVLPKPVITFTPVANPFNSYLYGTFTFNTPITGFDSSDIVVSNGKIETFNKSINEVVISGTIEGTVTIDIAADALKNMGGVGNAATKFTAVYDKTPPIKPVITEISDYTCVGNKEITGDNTLTISGKAEKGSTVEVFINSSSIGTLVVGDTGIFIYDHTNTVLADGIYNITAKARDAADNLSEASDTFTIIVSTTDGDNDGTADFCQTTTVVAKPSGVSPNGDGINDTWVIDLNGVTNIKVSIYGSNKLVYSNSNYQNTNGFGGTSNQGEKLPNGVYFYIIDYGNNTKKSGFLIIN